MTCHGSGASGAQTDVADGDWEGATPGDLNGGGFTSYDGSAVTSIHDANNTTAAAWGNGANRGVTGALAGGNLTCVSCHDPHGSANYRIIRATVNGVAVSVQQVDEGAGKDYTSEIWGTGMSNFCAACHGAYHKTAAGQGSTLDNGTYTHRIDIPYTYGSNANPETVGMGGYTLPLAESGTNNNVVCSTCHLSHGSSATMANYANSGALPGNTSATDSALLRLNNRGVCEVCHQK